MSEMVRTPRHVDPEDKQAVCRVADEDGALWLPGLIPSSDVAPLAELVDSWLLEHSWINDEGKPLVSTPAYNAPGFIRLQQWVLSSSHFNALRHHPRVLEVLEIVCAGQVMPYLGDVVRVASPSDPPMGTLPHQDAFYLKNDTVLWTVWMPLIPTPLTLGPLAVWPGSSHLGRLAHRGNGMGSQGIVVPKDAWWAAADMVPGDVWLFEGLTVHKSLPNISAASMRRSVDFRHVPQKKMGAD